MNHRKIDPKDLKKVMKDIYETKWQGGPVSGYLSRITYGGRQYYRFISGEYEANRWDLTLKEIGEPK